MPHKEGKIIMKYMNNYKKWLDNSYFDIETNNIKTVFMISCNKHSECELNSLLSMLANSMDGWIGQDSEGFSPATKL